MSTQQKHKPYTKFKYFLTSRNISYEDLGRLLNVTATTIKKKIDGESDFYLSEQEKICTMFQLHPNIFFDNSCCSFDDETQKLQTI